MTIQRIGKNPKAAPSVPARTAWLIGMERAMSEASHALIRTMPSRMNNASNGSIATRAVMNSDPATASRTGRNMGNTSVCCGDGLPLGDAEVCWGQTSDRGVEHLDGVGERQVSARALDRRGHLHQAAGVGGDEHLG